MTPSVRLRSAAYALALAVVAGGCDDQGSGAAGGAGGAAGGTGGASDGGGGFGGAAKVVPTEAQWATLQSLRWVDEPPPPDVTNAFADSAAAAALGQRLFFDPRFSGALLEGDNDGGPGTLGAQGEVGRVACAGCHIAESFFSDTRSPGQQISLASGWVLRRTPPLLDVGHKQLLHWDGRRDTFFGQALGVIESSREMNSSRYFFVQQLVALYKAEYEAVFGPLPAFDDTARFPPLAAELTGCPELDSTPSECQGRPGDEGLYDALSAADQDAVTRAAVNGGKAIGAYLRKLSCGAGRFDRWLDGDEAALTDDEKRGAILFVDQGKCADCHSGPRLSDQAFHNVGLMAGTIAVVFIDKDDPGAFVGLNAALTDPLSSQSMYSDGDDGRLPDIVDNAMLGAFVTPHLRCISPRPSFMHTGQYKELRDVVKLFERGGHPGGFLGENELSPLGLDDQAIDDLVAFLLTLDGPGPDPALLAAPR